MQSVDLGVIERPVLLFGGVYGNLQALQAVLAEAKGLGAVPICTGDIVAYCADGAACCDLFERENLATIAGNCERNLAMGAADCGCGFAKGSACDMLSNGWYRHAQNTLSQRNLHWMRALPDHITFTHSGHRYALVHGGVDDISRFVWPGSSEIAGQIRLAENFMGPLDMVVAGHSGISFRNGRWLNAGAIGMPAHNGQVDTVYAVLDAGGIRFERLEYDVQAAVAAMENAGLVQGYQRALQTGWWPSEDVLPAWRRRAAQKAGVFQAPAP